MQQRACLPSPMRSPQNSMGALSFSPSPIATVCAETEKESNHAGIRGGARTYDDNAVKRDAAQYLSHSVHSCAVSRVLLSLAKPVRSGERRRLCHADLSKASGV